MQKKINVRLIKTKRSYSAEELAETLHVHIQTVRDWRRGGLKPLDETSHPHLFMGMEIKVFLRNKILSRKKKLNAGEAYCLGCKKAVVPLNAKVLKRIQTLGHGKQSAVFTGKCPHCKKTVNRFGLFVKLTQMQEIRLREGKNPSDNLRMFDS